VKIGPGWGLIEAQCFVQAVKEGTITEISLSGAGAISNLAAAHIALHAPMFLDGVKISGGKGHFESFAQLRSAWSDMRGCPFCSGVCPCTKYDLFRSSDRDETRWGNNTSIQQHDEHSTCKLCGHVWDDVNVCFAGDGIVVLCSGDVCRVDQLRPGHRVWSPTLKKPATILATTRQQVINRRMVCVQGLWLTSGHPLLINGDWRQPKSFGIPEIKSMEVHNILLDRGGTVCVNGLTVLTLGNDREAGRLPPHPLWGTQRVVRYLERYTSWPEVELPRYHEAH